MAPFTNLLRTARNAGFEKYSKGLGDMLFITSALGWILSSAGQIVGIAANDKISTKKKKFLIPQEIADAVINIGSFILVTGSIKKGMKYLASSGKITTKEITEFCKKHKIETLKKADIGKAISKKASELETMLKLNTEREVVIEPAKKLGFEKEVKELKSFYDKTYSPFEDGLSVAGTVVGGVISGNIITPWLRNPLAAAKQKMDIATEQYDKQQALLKKPNTETLNKQSLNTYSPRITPTSGSMKI